MIHNGLKELTGAYSDELTKLRRKLHREPEVSWEEFKTTQFICEYLDGLGIPFKRTEPTGVIAEIAGGKPGKTVALRGDMDALQVE
ncbi:amidohydrolase, partial [Escherichia coli]|nr:amidohydrolase [Escherichia coli]